MAKVPLLEGEEIISSVKLPKEKTTLMLTNDGWLVIPVEHSIPNISNLSRLFHVNSIKKIEMLGHPWRDQFHALITNLLCIGSILYACYIYVGTFGPTNLYTSQEFLDAWMDYQPITDKIFLHLFFLPLMLIFIQRFIIGKEELHIDYIDKDSAISSIILARHHSSITTNLILVSVCLMIITWTFAETIFSLRMTHIFIISALIIITSTGRNILEEILFWRPRKRFFVSERRVKNNIANFYKKINIFLPIHEVDGKQIIDRSQTDFVKSLPPEFHKLRKRVEAHDAILSQIVEDYNYIFNSSKAFVGGSIVRTTTEQLLSFRVKKILPKAQKNKNLSDFRNLLNKHDISLTDNILRDIDQISVLGNSAIHNMEASTSDYMSMLEKFVNVVDWHISNPPTSIVNDDE